MTTNEMKQVNELQRQGLGYRRIAEETGLNENTIKAYLHRHPIEPEEISVLESVCKYCGTSITSLPRHKTKQKYCCRKCYGDSRRKALPND